MKPIQNQYGFTLVEGIVAGVIGVIVSVMFIAFMRMHNDAVNEGVALNRMQFQADLVSAEIARKVRVANAALALDESWNAAPALAERNTDVIVLYDKLGAKVGGYSVTGNILKESSDGIAFQPFLAGRDTVRVAAGSGFGLLVKRNGVALKLKIAMQYRNKSYESMAKGDMYLCRN